MAMNHDISLTNTGGTPPTLPPCHEGDTITFTNNTSHKVTSITLPDCVKDRKTLPPPATPANPLLIGKTTPYHYEIDAGTKRKKPYDYDYGWATTKDHGKIHIFNTVNGTIDVS